MCKRRVAHLVNVDPAVVVGRVLECGGEHIRRRRPPLGRTVQLAEAAARSNTDFCRDG